MDLRIANKPRRTLMIRQLHVLVAAILLTPRMYEKQQCHSRQYASCSQTILQNRHWLEYPPILFSYCPVHALHAFLVAYSPIFAHPIASVFPAPFPKL